MLPRQPRSPNNPIPNQPFSYENLYYLQGDQGIIPLSDSLYINPASGAFTTIQPPTPFNPFTDAVFYYDFGDPDCYSGSGTAINDLGPLGNNATIFGNLTYSLLGGGCLSFSEEEDGNVSLEYTDPGLQMNSQFSYALWVRTTDSGSSYRSIIDNGNDNSLFCTSSGELVLYSPNSYSSVYLGEETWYHVAVCYQYPGTTEIYIDGAQVSSLESEENANSPSSVFGIGAGIDEFPPTSGYSEPWIGQIATAAVYRVKLSAENISSLYLNSVSRFNP